MYIFELIAFFLKIFDS